jgi:hypothetical protein
MAVMIPIGAIPSRISSAQPIAVARNCFVNSSPNSVRSGARSLKALLAKFELSTLGVAVAVADAVVVVDMTARIRRALPGAFNFSSDDRRSKLCGNVQEKERPIGAEMQPRNEGWGWLHDVFADFLHKPIIIPNRSHTSRYKGEQF